MNKFFNIKSLSVLLYSIFVALLLVFIYTLYLEITSFSFIYHEQMGSGQLDFLKDLFTSFSLSIPIGAASLAFLTLGLTASRTIRMDRQIEKMNEQLEVSNKQIGLIEKQREASYQPELFLDRFNITVATRGDKQFQGKFIFYQISISNRPQMHVFNVGRAVAKSIEYYFSFDYKRVIENIKIQDNMNYVDIDTNDRILTLNYNKVHIPIDKAVHELEYQLSKRFKSFVPDISQQKEGFWIDFPEVYLELYLTMWLILILKNDIKYISQNHFDTNTIPNFPKLMFHISYKDLGNKIHTKDYSISIIVPEFTSPIINGGIADSTNNFLIEPKELDNS